MNTPSTTAPSARTFAARNAKLFLLASSLVLSALVVGGFGINRSIAVFGNTWLAQDPARIAIAAAALIPAFLTCGLLLVAARLHYWSTTKPPTGSRKWSVLAILVALYAPFYWAISSGQWLLFPILPGFTAGLFTKPLDNQLAFIAASCTCSVLLVFSLCAVCDRLRCGRYAAPVLALTISILTSYAAYCFMRA